MVDKDMRRIYLACIFLFHQFYACVLAAGLTRGNATLTTYEQTKTGGGLVTLMLSNLTNENGVLSESMELCDQTTECDTYVIISVGSYDMGSDILNEATTQPKINHNNLLFNFFKETFAMNSSSLRHPMYVRVEANDEDTSGHQQIGKFSHVVRLWEPNSTHALLFSTPQNRAVSLELHVSVACHEFFYGPDCSQFCRPGVHGRTRCSEQGKEVCLDGTTDCLESPVRKPSTMAKTLSDSQDSSIKFFWTIPSACASLALIVALVVLVTVKIVRARSVQVLVVTNEPEGAPSKQHLTPGSPNSQSESPSSQPIANQQQQFIDASKFRNPIYALYPHHKYLRSCSTNTQSSVATDATDLATNNNDEYEDLDAFHPQTPPQPRLSPSSRRLLPPRPNGLV